MRSPYKLSDIAHREGEGPPRGSFGFAVHRVRLFEDQEEI